jgi:hypothetical protein
MSNKEGKRGREMTSVEKQPNPSEKAISIPALLMGKW